MSDFDFPSAPTLLGGEDDPDMASMEDGLNDETFGVTAEATDWEAEHERLAGIEGDYEFQEFDYEDDPPDGAGAAAVVAESNGATPAMQGPEQPHLQDMLHRQQLLAAAAAGVNTACNTAATSGGPIVGGDLDDFGPLEDMNAFCDKLVVDSDDELDDPSIITVSKNKPMRPRNSNSANYTTNPAAPHPGPPPVPSAVASLPPPPAAWAAALAAAAAAGIPGFARPPPPLPQQVQLPGASTVTTIDQLEAALFRQAASSAKQPQPLPGQPPMPQLPPVPLPPHASIMQLLQTMNVGGPGGPPLTPHQLTVLGMLAAHQQQQQRLAAFQQQQQQPQQQQQSQQPPPDPRMMHPLVHPRHNSPYPSFRRWPQEYGGLMTRRDKDSVIGIQTRVLEKEMEDPVTSDFYYITWRLKQARRNNPGIYPSVPIPVPRSVEDAIKAPQAQQSGHDASSAEGGGSDTPPQGRRHTDLLTGTLGCLTTSSVHTPRQIIDIRRLSIDDGGPVAPVSPGDLEQRRHRGLMLRIEQLYSVYLRFDDCEKRFLTSAEAEKRHICVTERRKALEALCAGFFEQGDLPLLLSVRKGRRLLQRVLNSCDKDLLFPALRSLIACLQELCRQYLDTEALTDLSLAFSAAIRRLEANLVENLLDFALRSSGPTSGALFGHELSSHWFFDLLGRHAHFCLAGKDSEGLRRMADRVAASLAELPADSLASIASALPTAGHLYAQIVDHLAPPVRRLSEPKFSRILVRQSTMEA